MKIPMDHTYIYIYNKNIYYIYPLVNYHNYGKSPCLMGKLTISMAIFNSYVKLPEGTSHSFNPYFSHIIGSQRSTMNHEWLVVEPYPSEKEDVLSVGMMTFSQLFLESHKVPWFQTTNQYIYIYVYVYNYMCI